MENNVIWSTLYFSWQS